MDDLWEAGDPYSLAPEVAQAVLDNETPHSFIERVFAEDLAKVEREDDELYQSLESD